MEYDNFEKDFLEASKLASDGMYIKAIEIYSELLTNDEIKNNPSLAIWPAGGIVSAIAFIGDEENKEDPEPDSEKYKELHKYLKIVIESYHQLDNSEQENYRTHTHGFENWESILSLMEANKPLDELTKNESRRGDYLIAPEVNGSNPGPEVLVPRKFRDDIFQSSSIVKSNYTKMSSNNEMDNKSKKKCHFYTSKGWGSEVGYASSNRIYSSKNGWGGSEVGHVKGNKIYSFGGFYGGNEVGHVKGNKIYSFGGFFGGNEVGYVKGNKIFSLSSLISEEVGYVKGNMQEFGSILLGGAAFLLLIHQVDGKMPACPYEGRVLAEKETKVLGFRWPYQAEIFKIQKNWKVKTPNDSSFGWIDVNGEIHKGIPYGGIKPHEKLSGGFTGIKIWHSGCYKGNDKIGSLVK